MILQSRLTFVCIAITAILVFAACSRPDFPAPVSNGTIEITFNNLLHSRVTANLKLNRVSTIDKMVVFSKYFPSEYIIVNGKMLSDFAITADERTDFSDSLGSGQFIRLTGLAGDFEKTVAIKLYAKFPNMAIYQVHYKNLGTVASSIESWVNNDYRAYTPSSVENTAPFWTLQSGSFRDAAVSVHALANGALLPGTQDTTIGYRMPLSTIWSNHAGLAVGHVETHPCPVSLPVQMTADHARLAVEHRQPQSLPPGETLSTVQTFVMVYPYDFFQALTDFRSFMRQRGIPLAKLTAGYDSLAVAGRDAPSQMRLNAKLWRAVAGADATFRVALDGEDPALEASVWGIGAVAQTDAMQSPASDLLRLFNRKQPYSGTYRGDLYDYAFDLPESHAIRKADTLFLSYFADSTYSGEIKIRDMEKKRKYTIRTVDGERTFRTLTKDEDTLMVRFEGQLLLEVFPADGELEQK